MQELMTLLNYTQAPFIFLAAKELWGAAWLRSGLLGQKISDSGSLLDLQHQEVTAATWEGGKATPALALQCRAQMPF